MPILSKSVNYLINYHSFELLIDSFSFREYPDYFDEIQKPIAFTIIKKNIKVLFYSKILQFISLCILKGLLELVKDC